jgi:hypothetical protein
MTKKTSGPIRDSKGRYVKKVTTVTTTTTTTTTTTAPVLRNYIGISRDHSGSMASIARPAARDYNSNIAVIKESSAKQNQETFVSVVRCGGEVRREVSNSPVASLQSINESYYQASGGTPLFDSVGDLIEQFERLPDARDPNVSFLIMAITDGEENTSIRYNAASIAQKIKQLQATDHWTFVFRVPNGYKNSLVRMGIPEGNILEWEQTERGVEVATRATAQAFDSYYTARSRGATMTKSFYQTDLSGVSKATIKSKLVDISPEVKFFDVTSTDAIKPFVEAKTRKPYVAGTAFYQLTKKEDEVQDYKQIALRDKKAGSVYSGVQARNILGLPHNGTVKVAPGNHGGYDIFIESTSVNRKLLPGTQVLYWAGAKS